MLEPPSPTSTTSTASPTSTTVAGDTCVDRGSAITSGPWQDQEGFGCDLYASFCDHESGIPDGELTAREACCACGGGIGRASCRERGKTWGVAVAVEEKGMGGRGNLSRQQTGNSSPPLLPHVLIGTPVPQTVKTSSE